MTVLNDLERRAPTAFLPAERGSAAELARQIDLVRSSPMVRLLLDASMGFAIVLNRHRQVVHVNHAFQAYMDTHGLVLASGQRVGELLHCVNSDESDGGCGTTEACTYCGVGRSTPFARQGARGAYECRIQTSEVGNDLDLLIRTTPLEIEDEAFLVLAATDISHEKRRRALEHIFFHDVMNTAGGIHGLAEIVNRAPPDVAAARYLPMLSVASRVLIDELASQRDLAAAEAGDLRASPRRFSTRALLHNLVDVCEHREVAAERTLAITETRDDVPIVSDRVLLLRVLANLVTNALEAEPVGAAVTVSCSLEGDRVHFSVHNPTVMSRAVQLQLFQRSFSTKGAGRGLGTYSIRLLTERYLGGSVRFESTVEAGTTFTIDLPLELAPGVN